MSYRTMPSQEDTRLVDVTPRESELRRMIINTFPQLSDVMIEDIVQAFERYWKGTISRTELFRLSKMRELERFNTYFGEFVE